MATNTSQRRAQKPAAVEGFQCLTHPIRVFTLRALSQEGSDLLSPKQVSRMLELPLANVAYHFVVLRKAHLVVVAETKPRRGAVEHYYKLTDQGRIALACADALDNPA
jgi:DNA-binding transcriptional ArsR family regulator